MHSPDSSSSSADDDVVGAIRELSIRAQQSGAVGGGGGGGAEAGRERASVATIRTARARRVNRGPACTTAGGQADGAQRGRAASIGGDLLGEGDLCVHASPALPSQQQKPPDRLLRSAAKSGNVADVRRLLAEHPDVARIADYHGVTALHHACSSGHAEIVGLLCRALNGQVSMPSDEGLPPLYYAVRAGHLPVVRILVASGAFRDEPFSSRDWGKTHLYIAAQQGHLDLVKYFVESLGVSVNDNRTHGRTALLIACKRNHVEVARYLLNLEPGKRADPNIPGEQYRTPLHIACHEGHLTICQLLLAHGADPHCIDSHLHPPQYYAQKQRHASIVQFWELAQHWTPLQVAVDARFVVDVKNFFSHSYTDFDRAIPVSSPHHPINLACTVQAYRDAKPVSIELCAVVRGGFSPWTPTTRDLFPRTYTRKALQLFLILERLSRSSRPQDGVFALVPSEIVFVIMTLFQRHDLKL